jgi:hypothetical protein
MKVDVCLNEKHHFHSVVAVDKVPFQTHSWIVQSLEGGGMILKWKW